MELDLPDFERRRLVRLLERSQDVICVLDADGRMIYASPSFEKVTGVPVESMLGRNDSRQDGTSPEDRAKILGAIERARAVPEEPQVVEYRGRHADGSMRWRELVATNLLTDPLVDGIVLHIRDITDRRRVEAEIHFRSTLIDAIGQPVIVTRRDGTVQFWNDAARDVFGWTRDEAIGRHIGEVTMTPDGWAELARWLGDGLIDGSNWSGELTLCRKDGSRFPAHVTNTRLRSADGSVVGNIGVTTDLTEQVELHENLRRDRQRLAETQRIANVGSFETDTDGTVIWSGELYQILGLPRSTVPSLVAYQDRVHPEDRVMLTAAIRKHVDEGQRLDVVHRVSQPGGDVRWVNLRGRIGTNGEQISVAVVDVTRLKRTEAELIHRSRHDALTGIANRTWLTTQLSSLLDEVTEGSHVHVALVDIDQLKFVNDSFGPQVGDRTLCAVAERLTAISRPGDVVGRFGGDEFLLLRSEPDHDEHLTGSSEDAFAATLGRELAEDLAAAFAEPFEVDGQQLRLTASIGISTGSRSGDAEDLLRDADAAMYEAKARGKAQYFLFDDRQRAVVARKLELETGLAAALEQGELKVSYQPIVDLCTGRTVGLEALARWDHPTLGTIAPEEFVPIAEQRGLILALGERVLRVASAQLAEWRAAGRCGPAGDDLWVAVNLSARQLTTPNLVSTVTAILRETGLPPENLHLEVTESVLMDDVSTSLDITRALRSLGVQISIDDFGTGYSSLAYLKQLPVGTLKVDRSFVEGVGRDATDTALVSTITALARSFGMDVVAEGVEDETQRAALIELGCTLGQGYLWGRPVPATEFADRLTRAGDA